MRKILFVIVEGPSDETALGVLFNRIFKNNSVYIEVVHGDITTDQKCSPANIVIKVTDLIRRYAQQRHFKKDDFMGVIHITDLDGTFVSDEYIHKDAAIQSTKYYMNEIRHPDPQTIISRNQRKRSNIERLCHTSTLWKTIPYHMYYMSCNLDHALYGKLNSSDDEKESDSYQFVTKFRNHPDQFVKMMWGLLPPGCNDFLSSWEYIKNDNHSLCRYSNLALCFPKNSDDNHLPTL